MEVETGKEEQGREEDMMKLKQKKKRKVPEKEQTVAPKEWKKKQQKLFRKRGSSFTLNKCNKMTLKDKGQKVLKRRPMMKLKDCQRKVDILVQKRRKLVDQMRSLQDDLWRYFRLRTSTFPLGVQDVSTSFNQDQNRRMEMGGDLTGTFNNVAVKMKKMIQRLALIEEKIKVLSVELDNNYFGRLSEQEFKEGQTLGMFNILKLATLHFKVLDHLKTQPIKYNSSAKLIWSDLKEDLTNKFPSADEDSLKDIIKQYVRKLKNRYLAERNYEYRMFLWSLKPKYSDIDIDQLLESIKNDKFKETNFGELSRKDLKDGLKEYINWMEHGDKSDAYEKALKEEYELALKEEENRGVSTLYKFVFLAMQRGHEMKFDGDPAEEVSKMHHLYEQIGRYAS